MSYGTSFTTPILVSALKHAALLCLYITAKNKCSNVSLLMHRPPNDTHVTKFIKGVPFMEFTLIEVVSSFRSLGFYHLQKCYL